jgi:hypothetical protein
MNCDLVRRLDRERMRRSYARDPGSGRAASRRYYAKVYGDPSRKVAKNKGRQERYQPARRQAKYAADPERHREAWHRYCARKITADPAEVEKLTALMRAKAALVAAIKKNQPRSPK